MIRGKFILTGLTALVFSLLHAQVEKVEPPYWWAGMKDPALQLMVYGENISKTKVLIDYPGVHLKSLDKTDNPNYLFLNLDIEEGTDAGSFQIGFMAEDGKKSDYKYKLLDREKKSALREGFDNSDVIYLLMPDRFANGNPGNDIIKGMRESVLDKSDITGRHGGDLAGITAHLDYLSEMGFSALWLNPFLENDMEQASYHGYSTTDYYKTDPRLGTNEEFKELSMRAEELGIKLIQDMVFNHIGLYHWWMDDPPSSDWINFYPDFVVTNHRHTVHQDPYVSEKDKMRMVNGWFVPTMPDINQRNTLLANYLIQNSIWWIEFGGLAGIRMDTYPYPDKEMMAMWNKRVLNEYPYFNIVGEEWNQDPGLVSYWQKGQVNTDGYDGYLPSLMDFPLQSALKKSLLSEDGWDSGWLTLYETIASDFLYPDPYNLVIFPDNHDMSRFYMQMGMDVDLYKLGIIYVLTTRGIPQIFYGSEILMTHEEGDHHGYIRKDFPGGWMGDPVNAFTGEGLADAEKEMQEFFKQMLNWRKNNPVIHTGKMLHFTPEKSIYVYGRFNEEKTVMVILNKGDQDVPLQTARFKELTGNFKFGEDVITGAQYNLDTEIVVPSVSGFVLELKN
ncbi:MAG: glycoside hydrolase family 13 protein [Bacteroidales bacterium]